MPFGLTLHVFLLQIGNELSFPKKHFLPHFFDIIVLCLRLGDFFDHPLHGIFLRVFGIYILLYFIIFYLRNICQKKQFEIDSIRYYNKYKHRKTK